MFKITLFITCLYAVSLAPTSGFVAEPVNVTDSIEVEGVADLLEETVEVADPQVTVANFVNSKQFFLATTERVNWFRAAHICKSHGMELARIDSMEENNIIAMLINMSGCAEESDYFWTSGNDLGAFREWYFLANGRPMSFTNWGVGEPNNSGGNERCVEMRFRNQAWSWNDRLCNTRSFFICEKKFD